MTNTLNTNATDYVVATAKAALGMVPFAGSLLAELAGSVIPKQRIDRLVGFAQALESKIDDLDQDAVRAKLSDENFTDLLEESARQAAQSVTEQRRQYLATLIASGVTETQVSFVESRHLLRILSQINDIEIVWLRFYHHPFMQGDEEFRNTHAGILKPIAANFGSDQATLDQHALQENYIEHLISLGLLRRQLYVDLKTGEPVFDKHMKAWKTQSAKVTPLGRLLLRHIGLDHLPKE